MSGAHWTIPFAARKESHSTQVLIHSHTHMVHRTICRTLNNNRAIWKDTGSRGRVVHHLHGFGRRSDQPLIHRLHRRGRLSPLLKVELWTLTGTTTVLAILRHRLVLLSFYNIQYLLHSDAIAQRFARLMTVRTVEKFATRR